MKYFTHKSVLIKNITTEQQTPFLMNVFIYDLSEDPLNISLICDKSVTTQNLAIFELLV